MVETTTVILIIVIILVLAGIGVALYFILRPKPVTDKPPGKTGDKTGWRTTVDSGCYNISGATYFVASDKSVCHITGATGGATGGLYPTLCRAGSTGGQTLRTVTNSRDFRDPTLPACTTSAGPGPTGSSPGNTGNTGSGNNGSGNNGSTGPGNIPGPTGTGIINSGNVLTGDVTLFRSTLNSGCYNVSGAVYYVASDNSVCHIRGGNNTLFPSLCPNGSILGQSLSTVTNNRDFNTPSLPSCTANLIPTGNNGTTLSTLPTGCYMFGDNRYYVKTTGNVCTASLNNLALYDSLCPSRNPPTLPNITLLGDNINTQCSMLDVSDRSNTQRINLLNETSTRVLGKIIQTTGDLVSLISVPTASVIPWMINPQIDRIACSNVTWFYNQSLENLTGADVLQGNIITNAVTLQPSLSTTSPTIWEFRPLNTTTNSLSGLFCVAGTFNCLYQNPEDGITAGGSLILKTYTGPDPKFNFHPRVRELLTPATNPACFV